jgi:hypothetical protein
MTFNSCQWSQWTYRYRTQWTYRYRSGHPTRQAPQYVQNLVTVDSPEIGHPPDPGKPVVFRTCPISGPHAIGGSASVAAKYRHFEDLSDLRVSVIMTVNYSPQQRLPLRSHIGNIQDPGIP